MTRRILAAILLAGGGALLAWIIRAAHEDARRAIAVGTLVGAGALLSLVALACRHVDIRGWVRNLACIVVVLLCIGVFVLRGQVIGSIYPAVPEVDVQRRQAIERWRDTLLRLGVGAGYLALSIAVLPRPAPRPGSIEDRPAEL